MNFSLITCTCNPNKQTFKKLVNSINSLKAEDFFYEWIIVDNNSNIPIRDLDYISEAALRNSRIKIISEKKPGLTNARITGVESSKYEWIIFFDDDNEPNHNYLTNLHDLIYKFPEVKCWGPGNINVILLNYKVSPWINANKEIFQKRNVKEVLITNKIEWAFDYPTGTGMIIEKKVLKSYMKYVREGCYTLTDRLGRSLSSGGDTQIVFHVVSQSMYVGLAPQLVIDHNIEHRKSKFTYIKKQTYAGTKSHIKAHNEVFKVNKFELVYKDNFGVFKRVVRWFVKNYKRLYDPVIVLDFFALLGSLHAPYFASNKKPPLILKYLVYFFVNDKR